MISGFRTDLTGRTFDRLTVVTFKGREGRDRREVWTCRCVCGRTVSVRRNNLLSGNTSSCGCANTDHGGAVHGKRMPEYVAWQNMINRCYGSNSPKNYRDRGLAVCKRWRDRGGFVLFLSDMGPRPSQNHTVERKKNWLGYSPKNCVWATRKAQQNNRRVCVYIRIGGEKLTVTQWAERGGISVSGLRKRLARGVPPEIAVVR